MSIDVSPSETLPSPNRLSDQVAAVLRGRIYRGELTPGDRIVETDLSRALNVSRAPVREALAVLEREGMIETLPYKGAVVASLNEQDVLEIRELRTALEGLAARAAAEAAAPELVGNLRTAYAAMVAALEADDSGSVALRHLEFHRVIAVASNYQRLVTILDQLAVRSFWRCKDGADLESPTWMGRYVTTYVSSKPLNRDPLTRLSLQWSRTSGRQIAASSVSSNTPPSRHISRRPSCPEPISTCSYLNRSIGQPKIVLLPPGVVTVSVGYERFECQRGGRL